MENNSTCPPSPAWPTRWPKDAFKPGAIALFLLVLLGAFIVGIVLTFAALLVFDHGILSRRSLTIIEALVGSLTVEVPVVIAVWLWLPRIAGFAWRDLGAVAPSMRDIAIALGGAVVATFVAAGVSGAVQGVTHAVHPQSVALMFTSLHQPWQIALFAGFAVIFGPFAEETFFRLFIFNAAMRYGGFWIGAIVSAVLFGLAHADPFNALPLACIGFILAAVYYYSRNAFSSAITHGTINAISLVVFLLNPHAATQ